MNCAGAETWLLTARSGSELPDPVRAHLAECRGCARRLTTLTRTDTAVRRLAPDPNPAARQRLAAALLHAPQNVPEPTTRNTPRTALPSPPKVITPSRFGIRSSGRGLGWLPRVAVGLAALLLLTIGWVVGRATAPRDVVHAPESETLAPVPAPTAVARVPLIPPVAPAPMGLPVAPQPALPAGLSARAARSAARVAADTNPVAQTEALENFAADVRAEVVRRAEAGDADGLARLTGLHERLLKLGVARQVARTPKEARPALAARIVERLKAAGDEASTATAQLPAAVGELVKPLAAACRETAEGIRNGHQPNVSGDWPAPPTPLETVAVQTLRVAGASDDLVRANESVQLAAALAQTATVLSSAGQSDDAGRVGDALATVLDAGVASNLERVESGDPGGALSREVTLVRENADRAMEPLERDLANANPVAKPGLERALSASAPGHAKATGKPPKHAPPGKPNPPGGQKKP